MKEEWRDIEGFEGKYMVSNTGKVKSLERTVWCGLNGGCCRTVSEKILKAKINSDGYLQVVLYKEGIKKTYKIHRLVAESFLPNPNNLPCINHKDENKENNIVSNLEWCSVSYNNTYNGKAKKIGEKLRGRKNSEEHNRKIAEKLSKPVYGINKVSGLIVEFPSAKEAGRTLGIANGHITRCCKGKLKSTGGFYWFYADEDDGTEQRRSIGGERNENKATCN